MTALEMMDINVVQYIIENWDNQNYIKSDKDGKKFIECLNTVYSLMEEGYRFESKAELKAFVASKGKSIDIIGAEIVEYRSELLSKQAKLPIPAKEKKPKEDTYQSFMERLLFHRGKRPEEDHFEDPSIQSIKVQLVQKNAILDRITYDYQMSLNLLASLENIDKLIVKNSFDNDNFEQALLSVKSLRDENSDK